jgi:hypothetical protein
MVFMMVDTDPWDLQKEIMICNVVYRTELIRSAHF